MTERTPAVDEQPTAEVAFESAGFVFASVRNVGVAIFAVQPSLEVVLNVRQVTTDLVRAHGKTSTCYITLSNTPLPNATIRKFFEGLTVELAPNLIAVASVILGDGFWASAMRAFVTSAHWMSKSNYKTRAFSNVEDAAQWLAPLHSDGSLAINGTNLGSQLALLLQRPSLR